MEQLPSNSRIGRRVELLTTEWILEQLAPGRFAAYSRYRAFVEAAPRRTPWEQLSSTIYLGSDEFRAEVEARRRAVGASGRG